MIGRTAERLRETAAAIGDTIRPQDIPALRLNPAGQHFVGQPWRSASARWQNGRWLIPIVAATSVATLITGVSLASTALHLAPPRRTGPSTAPVNVKSAALTFGTPKFIVTSLGGHGSVSATATGRLIARIPPPVKGFVIEGIGSAPDSDQVFVLAGQVRGVLEFFRIVLGANGKPGRAVRLPGPSVSLPPAISSNGLIDIPVALSMDGGSYAYAISRQLLGDAGSVPATVTIVNIASGASHTWSLWPAARTEIFQLSWHIARLSVVADIGDATVVHGAIVRHRGDELSALLWLHPAAGGNNLAADSKLVTFGWLSESATGHG